MSNNKSSSYLKYLPGIYHEPTLKESVPFVAEFLKVFEKILSGIDDGVAAVDELRNSQEVIGIEQILDSIHDYFDPLNIPGSLTVGKEFVSYLANWVALSLKQNWSEAKRCRLIADIVPLYKKRGTKEGLSQILQIFVGPEVSIEDIIPEIQVGIDSYIFENGGLRIGGYKPYFFAVRIVLIVKVIDINFFREFESNIRDIVNLEKPAHTYYVLYYDKNKTKFPGIQVGIHQKSEVGITTLIF